IRKLKANKDGKTFLILHLFWFVVLAVIFLFGPKQILLRYDAFKQTYDYGTNYTANILDKSYDERILENDYIITKRVRKGKRRYENVSENLAINERTVISIKDKVYRLSGHTDGKSNKVDVILLDDYAIRGNSNYPYFLTY